MAGRPHNFGGLAIASRALAGLAGGYALAAFFATTLALLSGGGRAEAAHAGAVPSFLVLTAAILWAFAARSALRAWLGIILPTLLLACATWWLKNGGTP